MNKKLIFIFIAVFIVIVIGGVLIWLSDQNTRWNVYGNDDYGFEIKYPAGWDHYLIRTDDIMFAFNGDIMFAPQNIITDFKKNPDEMEGGKILTFIIRYYDKYEYENSVQPILSADDEYGDVTTEDIVIDGVQGEGYTAEALMDWPGLSKGELAIDYVIPHGDGYLDFCLLDYQYIDTFKGMIDSVKLSNR